MTTSINPDRLCASVAHRLNPLDKMVNHLFCYVEEAAGPLQLCAGQDGGCEAAVHALRNIFQKVIKDISQLSSVDEERLLRSFEYIFGNISQCTYKPVNTPQAVV